MIIQSNLLKVEKEHLSVIVLVHPIDLFFDRRPYFFRHNEEAQRGVSEQ